MSLKKGPSSLKWKRTLWWGRGRARRMEAFMLKREKGNCSERASPKRVLFWTDDKSYIVESSWQNSRSCRKPCVWEVQACAVGIESLWRDTWKSLACMQKSSFLELTGNATLTMPPSSPPPFIRQHPLGTSLYLCLPSSIGIIYLYAHLYHLIMSSWEQWPRFIYLLTSSSKHSAWHHWNIVLSSTNLPPTSTKIAPTKNQQLVS